jgi:hypothetical protein
MLKTRKFFELHKQSPDRPTLIHPWDMLPRRQLPGNPSRSREDDCRSRDDMGDRRLEDNRSWSDLPLGDPPGQENPRDRRTLEWEKRQELEKHLA